MYVEQEKDQPPNRIDQLLGYRVNEEDPEDENRWDWLVKWKGKSYLHSSWVRGPSIEAFLRGKQRKQHFLKREREGRVDTERGKDIDGNYFNPDFVEVERVIGVRERQCEKEEEEYLDETDVTESESEGGDDRSEGASSAVTIKSLNDGGESSVRACPSCTSDDPDTSIACQTCPRSRSVAKSELPCLTGIGDGGAIALGDGVGEDKRHRKRLRQRWDYNQNKQTPQSAILAANTKEYLVKWRGLSYDQATWELPSDVQADAAIQR